MMRELLKPVLGLLVLTAVWYGVWSSLVSDHVEKVKATIHYHNQQFKSVRPTMVLKAEKVSATGFPFRQAVKIDRLSWSMIEGKETYLITTDVIEVEPMGGGEYRFHPTDQYDAMYAKDGDAPEHYHVVISDVPGLVMKAEDSKPETPMTGFKLFLPKVMATSMSLNGETVGANFEMPNYNFLVYLPVPKDVSRELWLMVGVLREALVYRTPPSNVPYRQ